MAEAEEGSWGDRAVDLALRGVIAAALRLPYEQRVPFMGAVARGVAGPLAGYRRRAMRNLALVRPDWGWGRRRDVAASALDNLGRTLIENYAWRELRARLHPEGATGAGLPALEAARARGRPVILLTGHYGNHMAPVHLLTLRGHLVGGLYRAMGNPFVNAHYAATMRDLSGPSFAKGARGNLGFVRHVAGGGIGLILFDLREASGVPLPFLGRPALTALTAAELALRFNAPLIPVWGVRGADGLTLEVAVEEPVAPTTPEGMMREATRRLEARVAADPGQWFWIHRRWKGAAEGG